MAKLGNLRPQAPRRHVEITTSRATSRPPEGVTVDLYDWATEAFTPGESARLKAFFDAIPELSLLPDEQDTQP